MPRQTLKRRADGRYRCKYKDQYFYGVTQAEALAKRDAYRRDEELNSAMEDHGITFQKYALRWIGVYKATATRAVYNAHAHAINVFCSFCGSMRMRDITPTDIAAAFNVYAGKSKSAIAKYTMTIRSIFKAAYNDGVIPRDICASVKSPTGTAGSHRALLPWERELVHRVSAVHRMGPAIMLMLYGGLRRGEMLAFDIDRDVDFEKGTITVREAVHYDGISPHVGSTKTKSGLRTIPLFQPLRAALEGKHGLVFSQNGTYASKTSFECALRSFLTACETELNGCRKMWYGKRQCDQGKTLPPWRSVTIRSHDFRHSFCTMLYDAGVDLKTAVKWMGHADEKMVLRIYSHLTSEREKSATIAATLYVEKMLAGSKPGSVTSE